MEELGAQSQATGLVSPEGVAVPVESSTPGIAYNTTVFQGSDIPTKFADFLDPKLKGHLATTPYASSFDRLATPDMWGKEKTLDFARKLSEQVGGLIRCNEMDRIASGEFDAFGLTCSQNDALGTAAKGAPVGFTLASDAPIVMPLYEAVPATAAHPNAAKLWINFMSSPEAQKMLYEVSFADLAALPIAKTPKINALGEGRQIPDRRHGFLSPSRSGRDEQGIGGRQKIFRDGKQNERAKRRRHAASVPDDFVRTGPDTVTGPLHASFLASGLSRPGPKPGRAVPIKIMGEDFTLYRGEGGTPSLAPRCAHRGTQLSTGWVEGDALRCFYHGWKYDGSGQCVEQPAERRRLRQQGQHPRYPTQEYLGLIFAYLGEGEPPPLPRYPVFEKEGVSHHHTYMRDCNFYNNLESGIQTAPYRFRASLIGFHRRRGSTGRCPKSPARKPIRYYSSDTARGRTGRFGDRRSSGRTSSISLLARGRQSGCVGRSISPGASRSMTSITAASRPITSR